MLNIDYRDARPIYEQVAGGIEDMVVHGVYAADEQLPSVRQLAAELSINPNTIQRAFALLESKGVIYSVKGRGNFVSADGASVRDRRLAEISAQLRALAKAARALGADDRLIAGWVLGEEGNT
ncbi:MAG: GntR family transcriptional regulator [Clostridiaceae bacterium]|nr:GntR family transcriptional regulator [Clostridiaceae bacterium]